MDKTASATDIVIVGGGMVGLSLALLLAQECSARGKPQSITVLEASTLQKREDAKHRSEKSTAKVCPSFDSRSTALSYTSIELLSALAVWPDLHRAATSIRHVHVSDNGHSGGVNINASDNRGQALGAVIDNPSLGDTLAQHVGQSAGVSLQHNARVNAIIMRKNGASISWHSDAGLSTLEASLVVLADGAESPLRTQLGLQTSWHGYQQDALIANVEFEQPHRGVAYERFTDKGPVALLPLGGSDHGRMAALIWTHPNDDVQHRLALSDSAFLAQLQKEFGYRLGRFTRVGKKGTYPLRLGLAKEQVRSSLVLVGNAAHALHPIAGQGFNLALRDAAHLAAVLGQAAERGQSLGSLSVLQSYVDGQQHDQATTTWISHNTNRLFSSRFLPVVVGRNMGLLSAECCPAIKQSLINQMIGRGSARAPLALWSSSLSRVAL